MKAIIIGVVSSLRLQQKFLDPGTQLTWEEHNDDSKFKDLSEWRDVDFTFTAQHPDWAEDSVVKKYFSDALSRDPTPRLRFENDEEPYATRYRAIKNNERKKEEQQHQYDDHPTNPGAENKRVVAKPDPQIATGTKPTEAKK